MKLQNSVNILRKGGSVKVVWRKGVTKRYEEMDHRNCGSLISRDFSSWR